jgi:hypothetical protein
MTKTRIPQLPLFLFLVIAMTGCRCGDCETDKTLSVAERINCLESWFHQSRDDLNLMRATTTLALTRSDGYALFF